MSLRTPDYVYNILRRWRGLCSIGKLGTNRLIRQCYHQYILFPFSTDKLMSKRRDHMEKMVALLLIAYMIALWVGETLRETIFPKDSRKLKLYTGLFIFLKLKIYLSLFNVLQAFSLALSAFKSCLLPARSNV